MSANPPAGPRASPRPVPSERRVTYFAFQGLLMAVLLLIFLTQAPPEATWGPRLVTLTALLTASLVVLRLLPANSLASWWFQVGLFIFDAALASAILHWSSVHAELYLIYLLIIFGAALTRNLAQSMVIAVLTSFLYLGANWDPVQGMPKDSPFWLRFIFLWVMSLLLAVLSRDSQRAQSAHDRKLRDQMVEMERLSSMGELSAEVAHRIKGPLTTIMVNAELLEPEFAHSPKAAGELRQIRDEAQRCRDILKNLLDLGRIEEMDRARFDLRDPLRSALDSVAAQARSKGVVLRAEGLRRGAIVLGDQPLLHEAVAAVLQNALEAVEEGGRVTLRLKAKRPALEWTAGSGGRSFVVEVEDDGRGIDPEDQDRIFKPFFTSKKSGGSGLGLSAALRIMQKHGGAVEAYSEGPGCGARFTLILPHHPRA